MSNFEFLLLGVIVGALFVLGLVLMLG